MSAPTGGDGDLKGNCGVPRFEGTDIVYTGTPELIARYAVLAVEPAHHRRRVLWHHPEHLAAMRAAVDGGCPAPIRPRHDRRRGRPAHQRRSHSSRPGRGPGGPPPLLPPPPPLGIRDRDVRPDSDVGEAAQGRARLVEANSSGSSALRRAT